MSRVERSRPSEPGVMISFAERFAASSQFDSILREGMALVERAAAYLDGEGRADAKELKGSAKLLYATESMRLTSRLLELASWLLIRRALRDGELTPDEAALRRRRVKLKTIGRPEHARGFDELPDELRRLIAASSALNDRILQLDRALAWVEPAAPGHPVLAPNAVAANLTRLRDAFAKEHG